MLGQDSVCKIVARRLKEQFGVDIEFGTELVTLAQDVTGVAASVNVKDEEKTIRVKYILGADGGRGDTKRVLSRIGFNAHPFAPALQV